MSIAVVAEKPSVARDIAAVVGATQRGDGYFEGGGYVVTWAIGHLVALGQPHEVNPSWKSWSLATLPMLPREFPLVVVAETKAQFAVVKRILAARDVESVVCATDAGREGELIFRYIYEAAGCRKAVSRLWISSLTPEAIRNGFRTLRNASEYDRLADAAKGRSRADWLVGMNLSRAYSLTLNQDISVGRVQTPTLAIVVERDLIIRNFVPEHYIEVIATFTAGTADGSANVDAAYDGTWFRAKPASERQDSLEPSQRNRLAPDGLEAAAIVARARVGEARIDSVKAEMRQFPPPLLYDLTELQRHANRLYGLSAQKTLNLAQALYERHKLLSYPRTDSRHLSQDITAMFPAIVAAVRGRYPGCLAPATGTAPLSRRFVDDTRVTDHHALIPTGVMARDAALSSEERKIYDLVCRRFLQAWHEDHLLAVTSVVTTITSRTQPTVVDRYESRGTAIERLGWKVLDVPKAKSTVPSRQHAKRDAASDAADDSDAPDQALPAGLARGQAQRVLDALAKSKRTKPPKHHTEATLLTAMENAGKTLEEKELSDAMRDLGLGTPATRAQIIETLLRRETISRSGKSLLATDKGIGLIQVVHPEVKSPVMTGEWEAKLKQLQRGQGDLASFMAGIEAYVTEVIARVVKQPPAAPTPSRAAPTTLPLREPHQSIVPEAGRAKPPVKPVASALTQVAPPIVGCRMASAVSATEHAAPAARRQASRVTEPVATPGGALAAPHVAASIAGASAMPRRIPIATASAGTLRELLHSSFGFDNFRPYQETVCRSAAEGRDLLLVMPTGAGKSLCYQLPGIARGGTTLVVSPLIALMEDQAKKLVAQGFRAERIHSGRARSESRQACIDYLAGKLDFLFLAPERLRVPGFPELLAKRTPALIAIDEAHCISQWGHDFRPEYRMLGQRLPALRPAPIIALTATATPQVQDDIVAQLGLERAERFIHGFRRTNIAIEIVELNPSERPHAIRQLLADKARRPAIVYAATRKSAEELGAALGGKLAAFYHAGLDAEVRDQIQSAFLEGRLEVIVATVAFGMGIDKANVRTIIHAALPGSVEGYYQEIGRAGRDGQPAVAVLMHSYTDRKTHEFFHERDYPDPELLASIYAKATRTPVAPDKLRRKLRIGAEEFEKAVEKLGIHGGLETSTDGELTRGNADWLSAYCAQRDHRHEQLELIGRFAQSHDCRMVHLVRHFGDQEDDNAPCGLCDVCSTSGSVVAQAREPSANEASAIARILQALGQDDEQAVGKLYRETFEPDELDRRSFEDLLHGLCRSGMVTVSEMSFEKDGRAITYQRVALTSAGRQQGTSLHGLSVVARPKVSSRNGVVKGRFRSKQNHAGEAAHGATSRASRYTSTGSRTAGSQTDGPKRGRKTLEQIPYARPSKSKSPKAGAAGARSAAKRAVVAASSTDARPSPGGGSKRVDKWFFINRAKRAKKASS